MNRLLRILLALAFAASMTLFAAAQEGRNSASSPSSNAALTGKDHAGTTMSDTSFIKKAAEGGMAEVEFGQLAEQKASSDDVKKFGQRMVDDHTKANEELKKVASEEHVKLPEGLSAKDKMTKAHLEKLSGAEFDRAYMKDMVKDHKADVTAFEQESQSGQESAVKNFAQQTLPTLREHLKEAERIAPTQQNGKTGE